MAVPQAYDSLDIPRFLSLQVRLAHLLHKVIAKSMVKSHPAVKNNLLNEKQQSEMYSIISKQLLSKNNARKVSLGTCPTVPVLCFLSKDKGNLKRIPLWGKIHHDYFKTNDQVKFLDLLCGHYVHREMPEIIAASIEEFLG